MELIIIIICNDINTIEPIKNTYLNINGIKYYFIVDKENNNENTIYFENINTNIHFKIIKYFENVKFDYMLITYDNSYINISNLKTLLDKLNSNDAIYLGGHGDYRNVQDYKFYFHSYNPGIVLSKMATKLLQYDGLMDNYNNLKIDNQLLNLSGVAIGYYAKLFNMKIIDNKNFTYCNYLGYPCHKNKLNYYDLIACSNMTITDINKYYNLLNKIKLVICPGGGFGNVLFQYFNGYALGMKYNCEVYYQNNYNYWRGDIDKYTMLKHLNFIDLNQDTDKYEEYNEKDFFYNEIILEKKNYKIHGYYQSYKYSDKYIDDIRNLMFSNVTTLYNKINDLYNSLSNGKPTCLIHVRRGDYLNYKDIHPTCSDEYYKKGMEIIDNCQYYIFSDDNNYISNWSILKEKDYKIIDLNNPEEILIFMSLCDNFIIANSTLSLCSYLLRKNKNAKIVGPKIWFGSGGYKYKIEDILPPNTIII